MQAAGGNQATRIVLIRHGHTASNTGPGARLSGLSDVPLSARGEAQVARLRERLRGSPPFKTIYSSPLCRARQTAAALEAEGLGPVRVCREVQEIDCGELDGLPLGDVERRHPDLWAANLKQLDDGFRWPGGESYRQFRARCLRAIRRLAGEHRGERIAVVTHAGVVSQILGSLAALGAARWEPYRPSYTALTEVAWRRGGASVLTFNDHSHLDPACL